MAERDPRYAVANSAVVNVSARKRGEQVTVTLTEQNGAEMYTRTYDCTIDGDDYVVFPNDLTSRIQTLLTAVCLCAKYPNTYEGDSRPAQLKR